MTESVEQAGNRTLFTDQGMLLSLIHGFDLYSRIQVVVKFN